MKYKNNFVIFCKTYDGDFERFKILKNSIDKFNRDNIPLYISCPKKDVKLFASLKNKKEKYTYEILTDEEISGDSTQNWSTQQIVKMAFAKTNIAEFYLVIDSDSYFIKDFYISDFMWDEKTPYIAITEGKYFRELCSILNDKNVFDLTKKIKEYFKRKGKDYWFYFTPVIFSSEVLKGLEKVESFEKLISLSPLEIHWHGEFLLHSNIINFKPCEPFFKCFNYQYEYNFWRKMGELEGDIQKNYLGIVMQNRWTKQDEFRNSFWIYFSRKITRLKHYINTDRAHLKHNRKYYKNLIKGFFKELFRGVK